MKLCLGTVQFGMDYGIKNQKQPSLEDSIDILDWATQNGVEAIDTAAAYGSAEFVVGEFLKKHTIPRNKLFISSKFLPNALDEVEPKNYARTIEKYLDEQLKRLNTDYLDAYLFHSSPYVFDDEKLEALHQIKSKGKAKHCGVSVYYPDEAIKCLESPLVDFMQLPFSIFDQRMQEEGVFDLAKSNKTQIHSRSAFIQGLILMLEDEVPVFLSEAKPIIREIDELCRKYGVPRISLAMNFVKQFDAISHLVIGVDNLEQLQEDVAFFQKDFSTDMLGEISQHFKNIDAKIVMPSLWSKQ